MQALHWAKKLRRVAIIVPVGIVNFLWEAENSTSKYDTTAWQISFRVNEISNGRVNVSSSLVTVLMSISCKVCAQAVRRRTRL